MSYPLTQNLGQFISGLRFSDLPEEVVTTVRTGFADCIGVMIAGAGEPGPKILKSVLKPAGNESALLFCEGRGSALDVARINGTAAHALDFDDTALRGHPSSPMVPAILAEAETLGSSGKQMITAYAAGYETWAELLRRDPLQKYEGWHATGVLGAIGAAAACASLRSLDPARSATAIALAASQSAGLVCNFGTMTKSFHAGNAAHAGILSARLAEAGFTASPKALEVPGGFLATVPFHESKIDWDSPLGCGSNWMLLRQGLSIKKYPVCFAAHRALDGMFEIIDANTIKPESVSKVTVTTSRRAAYMLSYAEPQTSLQAKFSMQFAMACALINQRVGLPELTDAFVQRKDVQALMRRVEMQPDEHDDPARPGYALFDQVQVQRSGQGPLVSSRITKVRGDPDFPLDGDGLWSKFEACIDASGKKLPARQLFDALMGLDQLSAVGDLPGLAARAGAKSMS